jgi:hypothetical protein
MALKGHRPFIRFNHAHHHVEAGCFAGTVGAQQTHDFTGTDFHGNPIDHPASAIFLGELFRGQQALRGRRGDNISGLGWLPLGLGWDFAHRKITWGS